MTYRNLATLAILGIALAITVECEIPPSEAPSRIDRASFKTLQAATQVDKTLPGSATQDFDGCGPSGTPGNKNEILDEGKNRFDVPQSIDPAITFSTLASTKATDTSLVGHGAQIDGYLVSVKEEAGESCNCGSGNEPDWDFHCYLGPTPDAPKNQCLICEVTPRMRFWSLAQMQGLVGKRLRVTGWVLDDTEHVTSSEVDNPGKRGNWRCSVLELHPITNLETL